MAAPRALASVQAGIVVAFLVAAGSARADERLECARAYEQAQRLQQRGENRKALDSAERCAASSCPTLLVDECKTWIPRIRQQLVRLEVHVAGADGCPLHDVAVEVDRGRQASPTDVLVDPGVHEIRATDAATKRSVDKTINAVRSERAVVELGFAPEGVTCSDASASFTTSPRSGIPKLAVGLGLTGGVLLVTGVTLGIVGALKRDDLDGCKPGCSTDQIDGARTFFVAGDVIGAIGLVSLGAATAVYFLTRGDAARASAFRPAPRGFELRF